MLVTLKNLILALINATLILVALCLWLGVSLTNNLRSLTDVVDRGLEAVAPIRQDVATARTELAGLRQTVAELRANPGDLAGDELAQVVAVLEQIDGRLADMQAQVTALADLPEEVLETAIGAVADELREMQPLTQGADGG